MIVAFLGWFESDDAVFLAMEYVPFGDLSKYITTGEIQERDAKQIARDMLEALIIIHEEGFTHRDIKPQVRTSYDALLIRNNASRDKNAYSYAP